jgi:hypothetical protein
MNKNDTVSTEALLSCIRATRHQPNNNDNQKVVLKNDLNVKPYLSWLDNNHRHSRKSRKTHY